MLIQAALGALAPSDRALLCRLACFPASSPTNVRSPLFRPTDTTTHETVTTYPGDASTPHASITTRRILRVTVSTTLDDASSSTVYCPCIRCYPDHCIIPRNRLPRLIGLPIYLWPYGLSRRVTCLDSTLLRPSSSDVVVDFLPSAREVLGFSAILFITITSLPYVPVEFIFRSSITAVRAMLLLLEAQRSREYQLVVRGFVADPLGWVGGVSVVLICV